MSQYLIALCFILIGFFGAYLHYVKDRYFEKKIDCTLWFYITNDKKSTWNLVQSVFAAAIPLAMVHEGGYIPSLSELYACIGAGYGLDSLLNRAYKEGE